MSSEERARSHRAPDEITIVDLPAAVGLKIIGVTVYSFLIGYMLSEHCTHRAGSGFGFALAMAAHFVGLGHFYRHRYPRLYDSGLRYMLAGALYGGWVLGVVAELSDPAYALLFTFLAGGIIGLTAVFEVPRVTSWRPYVRFCTGAMGFSALIVLVENLDL